MKFILALSYLITVGCSQQRNAGLSLSPSETPVLIEINSVPSPFDINGKDPYVVWVNGRKVDPPKEYIEELVEKMGAENITKSEGEDIHEGWLWPRNSSPSENRAATKRLRIVGER